MQIRLAAPLQSDSVVDGFGVRTVIWTQGCSHNCPFCQNPSTHAFDGGSLFEIEDIFEEIDNLVGQDGLTLSGGDPLFQIDAILEISKYAKMKGLNIWCYTGFTYETLISKIEENKDILELLENIDVLIDGKFILEEKSLDLLFRGSKNQRIIDVPKSLKENKVSLVEKYYVEKKKESPLNRKYMFI